MPFPTTPTNGQVYVETAVTPNKTYIWDSALGIWKLQTTTSTVTPPAAPLKLDDLTDVTLVSPKPVPLTGDVLSFNGVDWQASPISTVVGAKDKLKLMDGGMSWGRMVARGPDIYRAGDTTLSRIDGLGNFDPSALTGYTNLYYAHRVPLTDRQRIPTTFTKIYNTPGACAALGSDGIVYVNGLDGVGQMGLDGVTGPANTTCNGMTPLMDPNLWTLNTTVVDLFGPNVCPDEKSDQGTFFAVVLNSVTGVYTNYVWGSDGTRLTGGTVAGNKGKPVKIDAFPAGTYITAASIVGERAALVVLNDGSVWGVGYNVNGALGVGSSSAIISQFTQCLTVGGTPVTNAKDVKIAWWEGTAAASYVLLTTGEVLATGDNRNANLSDGTTTSRALFDYMKVQSGLRHTNIKKIAAGASCSLFTLANNGQLSHSGINVDGARGDGSAVNSRFLMYTTLCQVSVEDFWVPHFVRGYTTMYHRKWDGLLYASGSNYGYVVGNPTTGNTTQIISGLFVSLPAAERVIDIKPAGGVGDSGGFYCGVLALTDANRVYAWGRNDVAVSMAGQPRYIGSPQPLIDIGPAN